MLMLKSDVLSITESELPTYAVFLQVATTPALMREEEGQ